MSFSQSAVTSVSVYPEGTDLLVTWLSTAPAGSVYQVYVNQRLSWFGMGLRCHVPVPAGTLAENVWVDVGVVDAGNATVDYSSQLATPARGGTKARLTWQGGTYLDPTGNDDVGGFYIYQSSAANQPLDTTRAVDDVPAYPGGWVSDGFGLGGFGGGGFGRVSGSYAWVSGILGSGSWQFLVAPHDRQGNQLGGGQTVSVNVAAAPRPPARDASGRRLSYSYSGPAQRQVTLQWLASPSA